MSIELTLHEPNCEPKQVRVLYPPRQWEYIRVADTEYQAVSVTHEAIPAGQSGEPSVVVGVLRPEVGT